MSDWRPIKSAPKSEWVLIWDAFYKNIHMACRVGGGWETAGGNDDIGPTHWMSLPDPPEEAG